MPSARRAPGGELLPEVARLVVGVANLGDGVGPPHGGAAARGLADRPPILLVAMAALLQRLPWLMFGLYAGVIADRHDRSGS